METPSPTASAINNDPVSMLPSVQQSENTESSATEESKSTTCFPRSALVGLGGEFVNLYSPRMESPAEFLFASWHACFGAAISPFVRLKSVLNLPPRIYVVNLGSSAIPRKSTSIKVALQIWQPPAVISAAPVDNPHFRTENGLGSVEGFVRVFNGWNRKEENDGGDHRPTLVVYDELKSFIDKARQKGSTLLPFLTSMFEGEDYDNTTTKQRSSVRGCHIGLVGACTLDTFADMWSSEFTSIGFPNRLFLIKGDPQHRIPLPTHPPERQVEELQNRMFALVGKLRERHGKGQGTISLNDEAEGLWRDYYMSGMPQGIHAKRLDTYAFKWMMLLALSQEAFEIDRSVVDQAIKLAEYQFQIRQCYDPIDADNRHAQMEEKIRRAVRGAAPKALPYRELTANTNAHRVGIWMFNSALENVVKSGVIKQNGSRKEWVWVGEK